MSCIRHNEVANVGTLVVGILDPILCLVGGFGMPKAVTASNLPRIEEFDLLFCLMRKEERKAEKKGDIPSVLPQTKRGCRDGKTNDRSVDLEARLVCCL